MEKMELEEAGMEKSASREKMTSRCRSGRERWRKFFYGGGETERKETARNRKREGRRNGREIERGRKGEMEERTESWNGISIEREKDLSRYFLLSHSLPFLSLSLIFSLSLSFFSILVQLRAQLRSNLIFSRK